MQILSARYGQPETENDGTPINPLYRGILIETDTNGVVACCEADAGSSGGVWDALAAWIGAGNTIAAYSPPAT